MRCRYSRGAQSQGDGGRVACCCFPSTFAPMTEWEYLTAPILSHVAQRILNNFGADGWELVTLAPGPNPDTLVGYFKRPLEG